MGADYRKASRGVLQFSADSNQAANSTIYQGQGFDSNIEDRVSIPVPYAGVLEHLYAKASIAPGVGETYTYTVYVNGAPTAITCQTAGAVAVVSNDVVNAVAVAAGAEVSVQCVTSLNSGVGIHMAGLGYRT